MPDRKGGGTMNDLEWQRRAAKRFMEKAGLAEDKAKEIALICYGNLEEIEETIDTLAPEEAVDDELSYWTD